MGWLLRALSTSVGRKFVMAITGLLLCGFLVAHLAGNLLLFVGAQQYNDYAHALHKNEALLWVAETGLFALFIAHIVIALQVSAENRLARKVGYATSQSKQEGRYAADGFRPDSWMLATGIVVLGFIILHLIDFKFEQRPDKSLYVGANGAAVEPAVKAANLLKTPLTRIGYGIGCLFLIFHLAHGFQSAFQTLGVNHPKYTPLIKLVGLLFAIAIGVGFASFPLWWSVGNDGRPSTSSQFQPMSHLVPSPAAMSLEHSTILWVESPPGTLKGVDDPRIEQRVNSKAKNELGRPE